MAVKEQRMNVEAFWEQYANRPYELIHGEVVEVPPTGYEHGSIARRVSAQLGDFVDENQLGDVVGAETGFQLSESVMRAPDAAFINRAKVTGITERGKFLPFPPDLAVVVHFPDGTAKKVPENGMLDGGDVLPGLAIPVAALFPPG